MKLKMVEGSPAEEASESPKKEKIEDYHVEDGFRHMLEAEKVKQNPELLAKVQAHAKKHGNALAAIQNAGPPPKAKSTDELRAIRAKMSTAKKGM